MAGASWPPYAFAMELQYRARELAERAQHAMDLVSDGERYVVDLEREIEDARSIIAHARAQLDGVQSRWLPPVPAAGSREAR